MKTTDTTELAYIGDAVYEVFIRTYVLENMPGRINIMNRNVINFVKANSQAKAMKLMLEEDFLSEKEVMLFKRARNHTNTNHPRGVSPMAYKMATGFEALVGYFYVNEDKQRLEEFILKSIDLIGGKDE